MIQEESSKTKLISIYQDVERKNLCQGEKVENLTSEMDKCELSVLGLCEVR